MEEELDQGPDSWNREPWQTPATGKRGALAKAKQASSEKSQVLPSQLPPDPELFEPSNRKKLLDHLIQIQFPALRDLAAKLLEGGCFLLEPADLTMAIIERLTVEADEYSENQPYWDWVRGHGAAVMHELLRDLEEGAGRDAELEKPLERKMVVGERKLHRAFNHLPLEKRRALYAVAILGDTIGEAASRLGIEEDFVVRLGREAICAIHAELREEMERIRDERTFGHVERGDADGQ